MRLGQEKLNLQVTLQDTVAGVASLGVREGPWGSYGVCWSGWFGGSGCPWRCLGLFEGAELASLGVQGAVRGYYRASGHPLTLPGCSFWGPGRERLNSDVSLKANCQFWGLGQERTNLEVSLRANCQVCRPGRERPI